MMNDKLEIEGDAREDIMETIDPSWADDGSDPEGFDNLQTPEEKAEFEAWLDEGTFDSIP